MVDPASVAADDAKQLHRVGARELLAHEPRDEAAAPHFAARFQAAERGEDVAPRGHQGLAANQVTEDHTPAEKKLAGEGVGALAGRSERGGVGDVLVLGASVGIGRCMGGDGSRRAGVGRRDEQRPPAGGVPWAGGAEAPLATAALWIDEGAQVIEAIGGDEAGGDQLPEAILYLARQPAGLLNQFAEEAGATAAERVEDGLGGVRQHRAAAACGVAARPRGIGDDIQRPAGREEPVEILAEEKRDRGDARRADPAAATVPVRAAAGVRAFPFAADFERGMGR